ncbi:hypothetical protein LYNGBM3L_74960 [Moorena producens 3L]|uniref:Transposase n=2 Tax=Coleofasciculaceae TaxID=1892251 RepID=F4Y440_9CYAN|nr:hypothetical protein LYNGBM3L_74960 [Moorena producens 3L]
MAYGHAWPMATPKANANNGRLSLFVFYFTQSCPTSTMKVLEFKVKGKKAQYAAIDEAIRTGQFVRNKCLRYWMDNKGCDSLVRNLI